MAKFISMEKDEKGIPVKHTYAAKDGKQFSARYAAVAMAMVDGYEGTATLREAIKLRREKLNIKGGK